MDLCDVVEVMYKTHQVLFKYDFTLNIGVIGHKLTKVFLRHTIFFWLAILCQQVTQNTIDFATGSSATAVIAHY